MADAARLAKVRDLFLATTPQPVVAVPAVAEATATPGRRPFSPFLVERSMAIAGQQPGDNGIDAVTREARNALSIEGRKLVRHALMVFAFHHPEGRRAVLRAIPRLRDRQAVGLLLIASELLRMKGVSPWPKGQF